MARRTIVTLLLLSLVAVACQDSDSQSPDSTVEAPGTTVATGTTPSEPAEATSISITRLASFEPIFHPMGADSNHYMTLYMMFDPLVELDFSDETLQTLTPALAESWEADGASVFTMHLRDDVTWQDGTPFTAADVVYTATWGAQNLDRILSFRPVWGELEGAAEALGTTNPVPGVEALDDYTVRFTLANPNSEFLRFLADAPNVIVPQHALKDIAPDDMETSEFTTNSPIGTGPYIVEDVAPGQHVEFVANENYFGGAPKIDRIFFKTISADAAYPQLETGELDLVLTIPITELERLLSKPDLNVRAVSDAGPAWMFTTDEKPPMDDPLVRQAFYLAVPRAEIVDSLLNGNATPISGPPGFPDYDDLDPYDYNPDRARELLEEADFDFSRPIKMPFISDNPLYGTLVPVFAQYLEDIGVTVELNPMELAAYRELLSERPRDNWDAIVTCCSDEVLSPLRSTNLFLAGDDAITATGYYNDELRAMFEAARSEGDAAAKDEILHDIARLLNTELPLLYLWVPQNVVASSQRLGGGFGVIPVFDRYTLMHVETWEVTE